MLPDMPPAPIIENSQTAYCIVSASHRYSLPVESLLSILLAEGGKPGMANKNENGSYDLGVMQINTVWLKPESPLYGYVSLESLKNDLCVNIHAAAWILATNLQKGGDIWRAVGRYHSPSNPSLAWRYMNRVNEKLERARLLVKSHPAYVQNVQNFFRPAEQLTRPADWAKKSEAPASGLQSEFSSFFPIQ